MPAGGLLMFHDFADPRNDDPTCLDTKVRPAGAASWVANQCDFEGTFGVCGLFARRQAPPSDHAAVADLSPLDHVRDQYLYRLRYPAGRLVRRIRGRR